MTAILFLFGLLFGSFANVCAWRIPRGESIAFPGSHCPACGAGIPWYRNLPLLSFILLRGRCASCRVRISLQYPLVELLCGILFAAQWLRFGAGAALFFGLLLSLVLLVVSVIDFHHLIIPDVLSLGLLCVGLAGAAWNPVLGDGSLPRLSAAAAGAAFGFGLFYLLAWGGEKAFKKEAMGEGDLKLMAGVGAFVGWKGVFIALLIASFLGTLVSLFLMLRGRYKRGDYLPFGPFLALGAWVSWTGGDRLASFLFGALSVPPAFP